MLGLILVIVLLWQVYKAASENGRNGILWVIIAFFGSLLLQLMIGVGVGFLIVIGTEFWGWPENMADTIADTMIWPINILTLIINGFAIWLLIKYLSKVPDTDSFMPPPPPPSDFN